MMMAMSTSNDKGVDDGNLKSSQIVLLHSETSADRYSDSEGAPSAAVMLSPHESFNNNNVEESVTTKTVAMDGVVPSRDDDVVDGASPLDDEAATHRHCDNTIETTTTTTATTADLGIADPNGDVDSTNEQKTLQPSITSSSASQQQQPLFAENEQLLVSANNTTGYEVASWSSDDSSVTSSSEKDTNNFDRSNCEAEVKDEMEDDASDTVEIIGVVQKPPSTDVGAPPSQNHISNITRTRTRTTNSTLVNPHLSSSMTTAAMASFHSRYQHMPQWMMTANGDSSSARSGNASTHTVNNRTTHSHQEGGAMTEGVVNAPTANAYDNTASASSLQHHVLNNDNSARQLQAASMSYQQQQQHQNHMPSYSEEIALPKAHTPTWSDILPKSYCLHHQRVQQRQRQLIQQQQPRKKLTLSLINMWEFTITIELMNTLSSSYYSYGSNNPYSTINNNTTITATDSTNGLRAQIKRIAREHIGRDGRQGAIFERSGNIGGEEDPMLKESTSTATSTLSGLQNHQQQLLQKQSSYLGDGNTQGKWRIPLGAYHSLMSYLTTCSQNYVVEGIPAQQLRVATLGRERMDKKSYATVSDLMSRRVVPTVCAALAPYQRGGVDFILDREGCALLADEMGLGKTVMAIAAMSAYRESDWPLLVLCPSSARYHWEMEFRHWMGVESRKMSDDTTTAAAAAAAAATETTTKEEDSILTNEQINVLTSGRDIILKRNGSTRVVICSVGLIVNLASSNRIHPGMFKAIIVDESHVLKSKTTKRTQAVLPLLKAARRCLLLSGTPALARPAELWPQLSALRSRCIPGANANLAVGIWCDEQEFMTKYVRGKGEDGKMTRLAELHTLLTSTVMIRRMKADILKNLPPKLREKAYIKIEDETMRNDFQLHMQLLRQGRGVLGKLARTHCNEQGVVESEQSQVRAGENGALHHKEVLHHLYKITGQSKVPRIAKMLKSFLSDPANGKLCIFAHHLDVLDTIGKGAGLSNSLGSTTRFIRIDGSTSPKARQEQILKFQTDPAIRVALLGITAAGVAVTLTASSTVWFAELFWTPAIMIQAEDRCHRIGQQARVRCLYFIARETLDEILWRLIELKFREIGEFVDGKENMGIALERELEDGEDEAILKLDDADDDGVTTKRKAQDMLSEDLLDTDDVELKKEIEELCHEEEDMFNSKKEEEEDELDIDDKAVSESNDNTMAPSESGTINAPAKTAPSETVIELLDEDEDTDINSLTISQIRELHLESGALGWPPIGPEVKFDNLRIYTVNYPGPSYGLMMVQCHGRIIVKSHQLPNNLNIPKIGTILVGVNGILIPYNAPLQKVLVYMRRIMQTPPVSVTYAEDNDFTSFFNENFLPNLPPQHVPAPPALQTSEVIELLDDDDDDDDE